MKKILSAAMLYDNIQEINDVKVLEETILEDKLSIYLIDSDKIINKNIITDKLNFLKPKDAIYKHLLEEAGIDDVCFNSDEALIEYIKEKISTSDEIQEDDIQDIEEITKERNMADITQIDEIFEDDLLNALGSEKSEKLEESQPKEIEEVSSEEIVADEVTEFNNEELHINSNNIDDVTKLIKELLNNKTLELSIKIKAL
jgi:hypothetical protein